LSTSPRRHTLSPSAAASLFLSSAVPKRGPVPDVDRGVVDVTSPSVPKRGPVSDVDRGVADVTSAWLPPGREFQKRRFRPVLYFHKEVGIRGHRRERWRDPSAVGVVSPRGQGIYPRAVNLSSKFILHISRALTNKIASLTNIEKYQKSSSRCFAHQIDQPSCQSIIILSGTTKSNNIRRRNKYCRLVK
jgi:hypothetical protein